MGTHESLEQLAMVGKSQMQELMSNYEILKSRILSIQIDRQGHNAPIGTGTPFSAHALNAHDPGRNL